MVTRSLSLTVSLGELMACEDAILCLEYFLILFRRFRWVLCQLESLRHCLPGTIRLVLEELPATLDETYRRILWEIPKSNREAAHRLLQCLAVAFRPLRVEELAEVVATSFNDGIPRSTENQRWEDAEETVLSICSSLVAVVKTEDSRVVRFSHFSVNQFLTSDRLAKSSSDISYYHVPIRPAHTVMAQACLDVLLRLDYHTNDKSINYLPLAQYAAQHWADHTGFENVLPHILDQLDRFLDADNPHLAAWLWLSRRNRSWRTETHPKPLEATPLLYIAEHGFTAVLRHLISKCPRDVHARDGLYGTPLHAALHEGHVEAYLLLLHHFDDVDVRDSMGQTTLYLAASYGHLEVLRVLIDRDVDIDARDDAGETPLHAALEYVTYESAPGNSLDLIRLLLEGDADANAQNNAGWTPLHKASCYGSLEATQLLLGHGAIPNVRNNEGKTPLHNALQPSIVRSLLEHEADPDAQDGDGSTALHAASSEGRLELVRLLLEHGANVHVKNTNGQAASEVASGRGHDAVMQMLSDYEGRSTVQ
jgi:ankyrin repeat protein